MRKHLHLAPVLRPSLPPVLITEFHANLKSSCGYRQVSSCKSSIGQVYTDHMRRKHFVTSMPDDRWISTMGPRIVSSLVQCRLFSAKGLDWFSGLYKLPCVITQSFASGFFLAKMYFLHRLLPAALAPFIVASSVLAVSTPSQRATLGLPVQLNSGREVVPFHPVTTFKVF